MRRKTLKIFFISLFSLLAAEVRFTSKQSNFQLATYGSKIIVDTPIFINDGTLSILQKSSTSLEATTTDKIAFSGGSFNSGDFNGSFDGEFDLTGGDQLILNGSKTLNVFSGTVAEGVQVQGSGNKITGRPFFSSSISLQDSLSELEIGIESKLNQNIVLNDGTLRLIDSLSLEDGIQIIGDGSLDVNNKKLVLPAVNSSAPISGTVTIENGNDISLSGYTPFSGNITFSGVGLSTHINGNGNILDLSSGGTINIGTGHKVYFTDINIKFLGSNGGNIVYLDQTSESFWSSSNISLDGNYTQLSGKATFQGANCTVFASGSNQYLVSSANAELVVDGITLFYDSLSSAQASINPISAISSGTISFLNNGIIRDLKNQSSGTLAFDLLNNSLDRNYSLTPSSSIQFLNPTPAAAKTINLDGNGTRIIFNNDSSQYFAVEENVTARLSNIVLENFDPARVDFQGAGATLGKIIFDDNSTLILENDLTINSSPITFQGNGEIIGNGATMTLSSADALTIDNSKVLKIKNLNLKTENSTAVHALNDSSEIEFQDSNLIMNASGINFDTGSFKIKGFSCFTGGDLSAVGTVPEFIFSSSESFSVQTLSTLKIDKNTQFFYNPDISGDGGLPSVEKYHFSLLNPSSRLILDSGTLKTGSMGLSFDQGSIFVDGKTTFDINSAVGAELEFGTATQVEIAPAAVMDIIGKIKYKTTTFP